jgi:SAM-dependent methyltransferase
MLVQVKSMTSTLAEISSELFKCPGERSKTLHCYNIYETFFGEVRESPINLFEVGVFNGESTKIFSRYFRRGFILGIDHSLKDIDLKGFDNVKLFQGDQSDEAFMGGLAEKHFPGGIDIVIDDASHIGSLSRSTFGILFPRLKSGGIYVIEDWGTGYWSDWPDGGLYETYETGVFHQGEFPKRFPSHDYGMVGFVKHVVDMVGMSDNRPTFKAEQRVQSQVKTMHIYPGTVVLQKV